VREEEAWILFFLVVSKKGTHLMDEQDIINQANALPINGSLTFKMLVAQRDWPAVYEMARSLIDHMSGVNPLQDSDWAYIRAESERDGYQDAAI
jgi:hypothetical protein